MHCGIQCYVKHFAASWLSIIIWVPAVCYQMVQRVHVRRAICVCVCVCDDEQRLNSGEDCISRTMACCIPLYLLYSGEET